MPKRKETKRKEEKRREARQEKTVLLKERIIDQSIMV